MRNNKMENYCVSSTLKNSIFLRIQQSMALIQILFHTMLHNTHTHSTQSTVHWFGASHVVYNITTIVVNEYDAERSL